MPMKRRTVGSGITAREMDVITTPFGEDDLALRRRLDEATLEECVGWLDSIVCDVLSEERLLIVDGAEHPDRPPPLPDGTTIGAITDGPRGFLINPNVEEQSSTWYALKIKIWIDRMRAAVARGDAEDAAVFGVALGTQMAEVALKFGWERHALRGKGVANAAAEGGRQRWAGSGWKHRAAELQAAIDQKHADRRDLSYHRLQELVAREFGCSQETVKRYTKKPKPG